MRPQLSLLLLACLPAAAASTLRPDTLAAWNGYIQAVESRLDGRAAAGFLSLCQEPVRRERVRNGEVLAWRNNFKTSASVPHGLIHDWTGAVFIPGVSIRDVVAVLEDYDRYAEYFAPVARIAKFIGRAADCDSFQVRYVQKALVMTVALDVRYELRYTQLDPARWYSVARSTSVRQIQNYGGPNEWALAPDDASAYVWRAFSICKFEEDDGGVYLEQESIALSRNIPVSLRWLVGPFVDRLSRDLVVGSLRQTRTAVLGRYTSRRDFSPDPSRDRNEADCR